MSAPESSEVDRVSRKIVELDRFIRSNREKRRSYTYRLFRKPSKAKPKKGWLWYLELYRGKAFSLKTADEREARAIRKEVVEMEREGKLVEIQKGEKITLKDFSKEYLAVADEMVRLGEIRPNTARNDRCALQKFTAIVGHAMPMRSIGREIVRKFKDEYLLLHGRTERAMRGCNAYMRHLSTAWDWAMREDRTPSGEVVKPSYVEMNPFKSETGRRGERMKFKVTARQPGPLYPEEVAAIRAAMYRKFRSFMKDANNPDLSALQRGKASAYMQGVLDTDRVFLSLLLTGMRINEMVRFEERDILLTINAVKVRSTEAMGEGIKDYEERHIKLHPRLRMLFELMLPDVQKRVGLARLVFPRWTNTSSLSHRLKHFFDLAGVKKPPYATRASFASYLVASGEDIASVQRMMGHSDLATTQKYMRAFYNLKDGSYGADYIDKLGRACRDFRYATG